MNQRERERQRADMRAEAERLRVAAAKRGAHPVSAHLRKSCAKGWDLLAAEAVRLEHRERQADEYDRHPGGEADADGPEPDPRSDEPEAA